MTDTKVLIVMAVPLHTADRERLLLLCGGLIPAIVPDSTAMPCTVCGMTLAVGPRSVDALKAHPTARLLCPLHAAAEIVKADAVETRHLGNPFSKLDTK